MMLNYSRFVLYDCKEVRPTGPQVWWLKSVTYLCVQLLRQTCLCDKKSKSYIPTKDPCLAHVALVSRSAVPKVTIRPVFNGTVPFLSCLSRCPNNSFRDAQMSRFWVQLLAFTVCCVRCNRTNGNIQVFAHSEMHKFAYKMHQNRCRPGRCPGPRWERSKLEYAKAVWSPLKLNYIDALEAVQRMATSIFKMFT